MRIVLSFLMLLSFNISFSQVEADIYPLHNPINTVYLQKNLRKSLPRLVYTKEIVTNIKTKLKTDLVLKNLYKAIQLNAAEIYKKPPVSFKIKGRRLLDISQEFLYRINILGFIYLIEEDEKSLKRINKELLAVSNFPNWNPKHFLDVGEMSLGVALAIDWTQNNLPKSTIELAKKSLLDKALNRTWNKKGKVWGISKLKNNWNQVCQGGIVAAALAVSDENPELASKTIHRALNTLPNALKAYAPNGAYPEGSTYWKYATSYSVVTIAMLESAFGTDFNHSKSPGFMDSALFRTLSNSHSEQTYNYFDCELNRQKNGDETLAWFATKTGNKSFFEEDRFLRNPKEMGKLFRFYGIAMSWISQFKENKANQLRTVYKGDGVNPIVIFKSDENNYYLGCKGGKAGVSHGNMDAGSFVFDLNGVRWSLDLPRQDYHKIEKTGFHLWSNYQNSDRWKLITKNNYGHSTITINNKKFKNTAFAPLIDFKDDKTPSATYDLTTIYGENIKKSTRTFTKDSNKSLLINDSFTASKNTKTITWQLITTADVEITEFGAILSKDGKKLKLENLSHPKIPIKIVSLNPPPHPLDIKEKGLKRLEIRVPIQEFKNDKLVLKTRLSGL